MRMSRDSGPVLHMWKLRLRFRTRSPPRPLFPEAPVFHPGAQRPEPGLLASLGPFLPGAGSPACSLASQEAADPV